MEGPTKILDFNIISEKSSSILIFYQRVNIVLCKNSRHTKSIQWNLCRHAPLVALKLSFCTEVSLIQKLNNGIEYYCWTRTSFLNREVSFIQSVFHREISLHVTQTNHIFQRCSIFTSTHPTKRRLILT